MGSNTSVALQSWGRKIHRYKALDVSVEKTIEGGRGSGTMKRKTGGECRSRKGVPPKCERRGEPDRIAARVRRPRL